MQGGAHVYWAFYPEVPLLLQQIRSKGLKIAVASRTHSPELAREMLSLLQLGRDEGTRGIDYFDAFEIYPGSKIAHFRSLKEKTGLEYSDMLFFDDDVEKNGEVEKQLGVQLIIVPNGLNSNVFSSGLLAWRDRRQKRAEEAKLKEGHEEAELKDGHEEAEMKEGHEEAELEGHEGK